ncbi:N-acetyltransferase [Raphidocelis subcapitata]|uniref:RNA cytidine acetyltransferase n=1 Tax=Raphidocelis subcapitata TaxID=307507 RepID=A0A2V0NJI7_9CHLO|nr:N-acetyltransferase [Raphidocelis subcapitata]|eukprot:GBF87381.1 N-acetyltransferase [Raphidocelis subcapitata]
MRKKVDARIRTLVENCVKLRQRGLFVIIGDKGRDQVVNLHYMLSKAAVKARPSVLWCYKKDLYLSSHRKKRMAQIKKMAQRGLLDPEKEDPFALFVASTNIRYCYYHETQNILGNTYGMAVLQDFEALTPNLLARTIETVEGGGLVVLLLSRLSSLTQLYTLAMDVHGRLRTEAHQDVTGRFNERLVLSLASCPNCLLVDDELNVLPTSSLARNIAPVPLDEEGSPLNDPSAAARAELAELQGSLADTQPAGSLVARCRSLDQARAVVTFLDAASEKTLRSTVALTASRGRGKSAALGLAIAGALGLGYANIFVTAPSPENLRTLFEFVFKGLDALGYQEHIDYDLVESTNPAFGRAVVRVNVYRNHRQTVQYIQPQHHSRLAQAELLVIDEAAAIPLPVVRAMLGPYLVFLCSTVNGYEGTGRSLSLKLIQQLREQAAKPPPAGGAGGGGGGGGAAGGGGGAGLGRTFREVTLSEPIRYAPNDPVESWLHGALCLDAASHLPRPPPKLPHPGECDLFYVERDTLFSFHKASETFLQRAVALLVASHYKNTPNDLLLLADAPAHQLFVLLAPNALPDVLAVVQVALEGEISAKAAASSLARGELPQGDLIPWTVGQQFQDPDFPRLSGARIVRIAVHPELPGAGYGTRRVELLRRYYQGEIAGLDEGSDSDEEGGAAPNGARAPGGGGGAARRAKDGGGGALLTECVRPRAGLPPLLVNLAERPPERLHYLGVSFGLTQQLYNFWNRGGFRPLYLRQSASEATGEHTTVMLRPLVHPDVEGTAWLDPFVDDFKRRFAMLLGGAFREMPPALALSLLAPRLNWSDAEAAAAGDAAVAHPDGTPLTPYDLKRLQAYSSNLVDYHLILDLLPALAATYFAGRLPATLSYGQAAILVTLGLQRREVGDVEGALGLPGNQVLALFNKAVRKLHTHLRAAKEAAIARALPRPSATPALRAAAAGGEGMEAELDAAAEEVQARLRAQFDPAELAQFAVAGADEDFARALGGSTPGSGGIVQVKSSGGGSAKKGGGGGGGKGGATPDSSLYKRQGGKKQKTPGGKEAGRSAKKHKKG